VVELVVDVHLVVVVVVDYLVEVIMELLEHTQ
jgi:hypothetical protein